MAIKGELRKGAYIIYTSDDVYKIGKIVHTSSAGYVELSCGKKILETSIISNDVTEWPKFSGEKITKSHS